VGDYTYERPGVASQAGALPLSHDAAGYLSERAALALAWDHLGRLVSAARGEETRGVFAYGPEEERVAKLEGGALTLYAGPDFEVRDGVSRAYARIERGRVARSQSTSLGVALYGDLSESGDVDAADAWLAREETESLESRHVAAARRLLHEAAPEPVQLFADHLGSLTGATRAGKVVGLRRYHPSGAIRAEQGFVDERGFTGQERDASTGLLAFQFRYLDTNTGRWISADPAFESLGDELESLFEAIGRYGYVGANPINAVDPTGLFQSRAVLHEFGSADAARQTLQGMLSSHRVDSRTINYAMDKINTFDFSNGNKMRLVRTVGDNRVVRITDGDHKALTSGYSADSADTRDRQAVLAGWSDRSMTYELDVPAGAIGLEGITAPQTDQQTGESRPGGGQQNLLLTNLTDQHIAASYDTPAENR